MQVFFRNLIIQDEYRNKLCHTLNATKNSCDGIFKRFKEYVDNLIYTETI